MSTTKLSPITPETIACLNAVLDSGSVPEGLRDALACLADKRRLNALSRASGVSYGTIYSYAHDNTKEMLLGNAEAILRAMGLKLYVKVET